MKVFTREIVGLIYMNRFILYLLIGLSVFPAPVFAYDLYLKSKHSFKSEVRLGDLGRVADANQAESIAGKLVVRNLKYPMYLSAADLKKKLVKATPERLNKVYGSGIWLIPANRVYNSEDLQKLLLNQISTLRGSSNLSDHLLIEVSQASKLELPAKGVSLKYRLPAHVRSLTPGKRILALDVHAVDANTGKSNFILRKNVAIQIRHWVHVAQATHDLTIGHRLGKSDFKIVRRAVFGSKRDFELGKKITGLKAVRAILAGQDLNIRNVQSLPAIRRGQNVRLVYQTKSVILRIKSVAQKSGEIGDEIMVRVVLPGGRYGKSLKGRIAGEGQVVAIGSKS